MTARPFVNWSRTVRSQPTAWARPSSEEAVAEIVAKAAERGGRVKVCGSRHSWSPIAAGDDVQLILDDLDRFVAVDPDAGTVTVEGGMPLHVLNDVLASHGLALPILGSITEQTIAGATATGTHGSSLVHGNVASGIVGARLVDGTGRVHDLGPDDPRLPGVRVGLGALGILTRLTVKVVPAFRLEERRLRIPLEEAPDRILELARQHEFAKLWWLPHCDHALAFLYDRTDLPGERDARAWAFDGWVNRTVFPALLALGGRLPSTIPTTNRLIDRIHFTPTVRRGRSDHMLTLVMPPVHRETELAFDVSHTPEALRAVRRLTSERGRRVDFIREVRFVQGDDTWMSPAFGRDTCQLGIYGARSPDVDAAFDDLREITAPWDARPHWGKEHDLGPDEVDRLYPLAGAFRALRTELDPQGVFASPYLDRVLGPV